MRKSSVRTFAAGMIISVVVACSSPGSTGNSAVQGLGRQTSAGAAAAHSLPSTVVQAVAQGHPWAQVNANAQAALTVARKAIEAWPQSASDIPGTNALPHYCEVFQHVRETYSGNSLRTLWGMETEPIELQYPVAMELLDTLGIAEALTRAQVLEQLFRIDHRSVFVAKHFASFELTEERVDPSQQMYLRYPIVLGVGEEVALEEFDWGGERYAAASSASVFSDDEDYAAACEHVTRLIEQILDHRASWNEDLLLDALGELAFVTAHMIYFEHTNWGVHYALQAALREHLRLPTRFSWGLDVMMLSIRDVETAIDYYKRWSTDDSVSETIMRYFQDPSHAEQADDFLAYLTSPDDIEPLQDNPSMPCRPLTP